MKRMKVEDVVQDVEQALAAVRSNEAIVIEQEDSDNLILLTQQQFQELLGGQRNPDAGTAQLSGGQRNPDSVGPQPAAGQPTPD